MKDPKDLSKEELLDFMTDMAKNWLAHDGLWFQAVEEKFGMDVAIELDMKAWERFTVIEAKRIKKRLNLPERGGLEALKQALKFRLYAFINKQVCEEIDERRFIFKMITCRVQEARRRKNLPPFPCKPVGFVEYSLFAKTIDPRIETRAILAPPDEEAGKEYWCAWEFTLKKEEESKPE